VTIPKPEHFFEQAEKLISTPVGGGALRQVDIRRAISAAYYGLFHATMAAAADLVVGANKRSGNHYALAYRKTDHGVLKGLCADITNKSLPQSLHGSPRLAGLIQTSVPLPLQLSHYS
jgi:uncharacterized protein (UPF0332 family)